MHLDVPAFDLGAIDRNQLISALYLPYMRAREHTSAREKKKSVLDFALFGQHNLIKSLPLTQCANMPNHIIFTYQKPSRGHWEPCQ
jgi:hypothetical protein